MASTLVADRTESAPASAAADSARSTGSRLRTGLLLVLIIEVAFLVRAIPVLQSDFPLNDGGMIYTMIEDLRANHLALPWYTSYNGAGIPYAYPPLAFYLVALLANARLLSVLDALHYLPLAFSTLAVVPVFALSRQILSSTRKGLIAALAFAVMPFSFTWHIMGGGLTRSLGLLFAVTTLALVYRLGGRRSRATLALAGLAGAGACLSHPEKAWCLVVTAALFWLVGFRTRRYAADLAAAGMLSAAIASPWWVTVLARHGLAPFEAALATGGFSLLNVLPILTFGFTKEFFVGVLPTLALLGALLCLRQRAWLVPVWLVAIFAIAPRTALRFGTIPLAVLAAVSLDDFVLPLARDISRRALRRSSAARWAEGAVVLFVAANGILACLSVLSEPESPLLTLTAADQSSFEWVTANTASGSRFLLITCTQGWGADRVQEWFPALTGRQSLGTVQGSEWLPGSRYRELEAGRERLDSCAGGGDTNRCVADWLGQVSAKPDYVYVAKAGAGRAGPGGGGYVYAMVPIAAEAVLGQSRLYSLVYDGPSALIYAANHLAGR